MDLTPDMVAQGGAAAVLIAVVIALITGKLRTQQEIEAWKARVEHDEAMIDRMIPMLQQLNESVNKLVRVHEQ